MTETTDRLDSWKAIAEYLNRDTRTLRRWQLKGLPVRRVPGGRGNSVFAFKSEVEEWLRAAGPEQPQAVAVSAKLESPAPAPSPVPTPPATLKTARPLRHRWLIAAVVFAVIFLGWRTFAPSAAPQQLDVRMTGNAVVATGPAGDEIWRYDFPPDIANFPAELVGSTRVVDGPRAAIFAMTGYRVAKPDNVRMTGVLRQFSMQGRLQGAFEFNDSWTFAGTSYQSPWVITDSQVNDAFGRRQIAVSGHHFTWWPGVVSILDERLQRLGTFVNSGWVDALRWISPDRLGIAGFNEALNGGMFGVLDTRGIDGASPEAPGTKYACDNCGPGRPVVYFVFPRSEMNRITGSRFNRAFVEVAPTGVRIRTDEVARENNEGSLVEAVYDFSLSFELISASYGDRYWDKHHALELEGKIKHTRAECPERDGPPLVKKWTREAGWTEIHPKR